MSIDDDYNAILNSHSNATKRSIDEDYYDIIKNNNSTSPAPVPSRGLSGFTTDTGVDLARGVNQIGQSVVGLGDLVTGGRATPFVSSVLGYSPKGADTALQSYYTPARQAAEQEIEAASQGGFLPTLGALATHPAELFGRVVQGAPALLPVMGAAKWAGAAAKLRGLTEAEQALARSAGTAGVFGAQQAGTQMQTDTEQGLPYSRSALEALASGAFTAGTALGVGAGARALGLAEPLAGTVGATPGVLRGAAGGAAEAGTMMGLTNVGNVGIHNVATDQPITQGMGPAAAEGFGTGLVMGGVGGGLGGRGRAPVQEREQTPAPEQAQSAQLLALPKPPIYGTDQRPVDQWGRVIDENTPINIGDSSPIYVGYPALPKPAIALPDETPRALGVFNLPDTRLADRDAERSRAIYEYAQRVAAARANKGLPSPAAFDALEAQRDAELERYMDSAPLGFTAPLLPPRGNEVKPRQLDAQSDIAARAANIQREQTGTTNEKAAAPNGIPPGRAPGQAPEGQGGQQAGSGIRQPNVGQAPEAPQGRPVAAPEGTVAAPSPALEAAPMGGSTLEAQPEPAGVPLRAPGAVKEEAPPRKVAAAGPAQGAQEPRPVPAAEGSPGVPPGGQGQEGRETAVAPQSAAATASAPARGLASAKPRREFTYQIKPVSDGFIIDSPDGGGTVLARRPSGPSVLDPVPAKRFETEHAARMFLQKRGMREVPQETTGSAPANVSQIPVSETKQAKGLTGKTQIPRNIRAIDETRDDLLTAIARAGGLSREEALAHGIDPAEINKRGPGTILHVFTKKGHSFDGMAANLAQYGYPVSDRQGYSPNVLLDHVHRALAGNRVPAARGIDAYAAALDADHQAGVDAREADAIASVVEEQQATPPVVDMVALLAQVRAVAGDDALSRVDEEVNNSPLTGAASDRFMIQRLHEEIENARTRNTAGVQDLGRGEEASNEEPPLLSTYTEADIRAREDAAAAQARAQVEADRRAAADAQRGGFALTGSDLEADQRAAAGQQPLFSRAPSPPLGGHSVDTLRTALSDGLRGRRLASMERSGLLRIVQSVADLPESATRLYHRAWHGSPATFDRFNLDKIKRAVHGFGLNFSSERALAEHYKRGEEGKLYQVDIRAEPGEYLDWDKPLTEQSPEVRERLGDLDLPQTDGAGNPLRGSTLYAWLSAQMGPRMASGFLEHAGIPGLRYSAGGKEGATNFTVFHPERVAIEARFSHLGKTAIPSDVAGMWDGHQLWLVADNIAAGEELGVLLHEGTHAGEKLQIGRVFDSLQNEFDRLYQRGDEAVRAAVDKVPEGLSPEGARYERMAYFVGEASKRLAADWQGASLSARAKMLYQRAMAALRAWIKATPFMQALARRMGPLQLTDAQVVALARQSLREAQRERVSMEHDVQGLAPAAAYSIRELDPRLRNLLKTYAGEKGAPSPAALAEAVRQYREVERAHTTELKAHDEQNEPLPAPNGKPSKLNREQWILTRTENFKKWFGDWEKDPENASKVVDANGEPLIVYHGSKIHNEFTVFREGAVWFSPDKELADSFAHQNPYSRSDESRPFFLNIRSMLDGDYNEAKYDELINEFEGLDVDGSILDEYYDGAYRSEAVVGINEYVVGNRGQIKYALGNAGTYDSANPDIRFSRRAPIPPAAGPVSAQTRPLLERLRDSAPGRVFTDGLRKALESDLLRDLQLKVAPITAARGAHGKWAQAAAKDYANLTREADQVEQHFTKILERNYKPDQLKNMWDAGDEENDLRAGRRQDGGLGRLDADQAAVIRQMSAYGDEVLREAQTEGMIGEGVDFWVPRVVAILGTGGKLERPPSGSPFSGEYGSLSTQSGTLSTRNGSLSTRSGSLMERKYATAAETEAAAKAKFGDTAQVVRDIRTMPMMMARTAKALAARKFINALEELSQQSGQNIISDREQPGYFTLDHPALQRFQPAMEQAENGEIRPVKDAKTGEQQYEKKQIYISKDFEGPVRAILSERPGPAYKAMMQLKGKSMAMIMYSPLIHLQVVLGKVIPLQPGRVFTGKIFSEGAAAMQNLDTVRRAARLGQVLLSREGYRNDIGDLTPGLEQLEAGKSWTAQAAGYLADKVKPGSGQAVREAIDKAGDFYHNKMLWDQVAKMQMGIFTGLERELIEKKGMVPEAAGRMAAEFSNMFVGSIPAESMSAAFRKWMNFVFFSRSFTFSNLAGMKGMFVGLSEGTRAQIERDFGSAEVQKAIKAGRGKAMEAVAMDIGLFLVGNALVQTGIDAVKKDKGIEDIYRDYADRFSRYMSKAKENPSSVFNLNSLFPGSENEPGKEGRILFDKDQQGTLTYMRLAFGKMGEEFTDIPTKPLQYLQRKEGTIFRPLMQTFTNDKGFGREVYDPYAEGISGAMKNIGSIAWNFLSQQVPTESIKAAGHIVSGDATQTDVLKTVGPLVGFTFSRGAPGGPAVGLASEIERHERSLRSAAAPGIREALAHGDTETAVELMRQAGMSAKEMIKMQQDAANPARRLSPGRLREAMRNATPEQREQMVRFLSER